MQIRYFFKNIENIWIVALLQASIFCLYNFCQSKMPCIMRVADVFYEMGLKRMENKQD